MNFLALKHPCRDCPFVPRPTGSYLHPARRAQIADSLRSDTWFACHKTVDYSDGSPGSTDDSARCFGASATLYKDSEVLTQAERIAERLGIGEVDTDAYLQASTFADLDDFVADVRPAQD